MNTKTALVPHLTQQHRNELKLVLYAVASALLPYAAATVLILFGQSQ